MDDSYIVYSTNKTVDENHIDAYEELILRNYENGYREIGKGFESKYRIHRRGQERN